jgi:hypothetical protein
MYKLAPNVFPAGVMGVVEVAEMVIPQTSFIK